MQLTARVYATRENNVGRKITIYNKKKYNFFFVYNKKATPVIGRCQARKFSLNDRMQEGEGIPTIAAAVVHDDSLMRD